MLWKIRTEAFVGPVEEGRNFYDLLLLGLTWGFKKQLSSSPFFVKVIVC